MMRICLNLKISGRCLAFLEQQVEEYERVELERMEERKLATKKIMEKMKQEENLNSFDGTQIQHCNLHFQHF